MPYKKKLSITASNTIITLWYWLWNLIKVKPIHVSYDQFYITEMDENSFHGIICENKVFENNPNKFLSQKTYFNERRNHIK